MTPSASASTPTTPCSKHSRGRGRRSPRSAILGWVASSRARRTERLRPGDSTSARSAWRCRAFPPPSGFDSGYLSTYYLSMADIDTRALDRELKKGSAELLILSLLDAR